MIYPKNRTICQKMQIESTTVEYDGKTYAIIPGEYEVSCTLMVDNHGNRTLHCVMLCDVISDVGNREAFLKNFARITRNTMTIILALIISSGYSI